MYASVQRIINRASVECPGVTNAAIAEALWDATNQFCRRTDANRFALAIPLVVFESLYTVELTDTVVVRVFDISHDRLDPKNAVFDPDNMELMLGVVPTVADTYMPAYINVSLAPKPASTNQDEWMPEPLWDRYYEAILDGTLMVLFTQVAKPWTSMVKAKFHGNRFRAGMNIMKQSSSVGHAPNARGWRFNRWGM